MNKQSKSHLDKARLSKNLIDPMSLIKGENANSVTNVGTDKGGDVLTSTVRIQQIKEQEGIMHPNPILKIKIHLMPCHNLRMILLTTK
jgi:hypothetical protein